MYKNKIIYSVGVPEIDRQHSTILDLIKECCSTIKEGSTYENTGYIIHKLLLYAKNHFSFEEELMRKADYSDIEEHIAEHEKFLEIVKGYEEIYISGKSPDITEIMEFIYNWFKHHIMVSDQKYVEALKKADII